MDVVADFSSVNPVLRRLALAGRNGDDRVAALRPEQAALLKRLGGAGTTNPETGLKEFYGLGLAGETRDKKPILSATPSDSLTGGTSAPLLSSTTPGDAIGDTTTSTYGGQFSGSTGLFGLMGPPGLTDVYGGLSQGNLAQSLAGLLGLTAGFAPGFAGPVGLVGTVANALGATPSTNPHGVGASDPGLVSNAAQAALAAALTEPPGPPGTDPGTEVGKGADTAGLGGEKGDTGPAGSDVGGQNGAEMSDSVGGAEAASSSGADTSSADSGGQSGGQQGGAESESFKDGGTVDGKLKKLFKRGSSGLIGGKGLGRKDDKNLKARPGAVVIPADAVAATGQGNSNAGADKIERMLGVAGGDRPGASSGTPIKASSGEFVVDDPQAIARFGGGDVDRGRKMLEDFIRSQRGKMLLTLLMANGPRSGQRMQDGGTVTQIHDKPAEYYYSTPEHLRNVWKTQYIEHHSPREGRDDRQASKVEFDKWGNAR